MGQHINKFSKEQKAQWVKEYGSEAKGYYRWTKENDPEKFREWYDRGKAKERERYATDPEYKKNKDEKHTQWIEDNREAYRDYQREYQRKYREANRKKVRAIQKKSCEKYKEENGMTPQQAYYHNNKDKILKRERKRRMSKRIEQFLHQKIAEFKPLCQDAHDKEYELEAWSDFFKVISEEFLKMSNKLKNKKKEQS